jgi:hypothetical protein
VFVRAENIPGLPLLFQEEEENRVPVGLAESLVLGQGSERPRPLLPAPRRPKHREILFVMNGRRRPGRFRNRLPRDCKHRKRREGTSLWLSYPELFVFGDPEPEGETPVGATENGSSNSRPAR